MRLSPLSLTLLLSAAAASVSRGQILLTENFPGVPGTPLTSSGWTQSGSTATNPVTAALPGGLRYEGYSSSAIGNAASLATSGQDVFRTFPACASGDVYLSFMLSVSSAQGGDYFVALSPETHQTSYFARLHARSSGVGYQLGISKNNEVAGGAMYGTTVFAFNTTILVVVRYAFVAADTNDDATSVFAFSGVDLPASEPVTPEIGPYTSARRDAPNLGIVTLRQGSAGASPALLIDGIRVAHSWNEAPLPVQLDRFTARALEGDRRIEIAWSTLSETNCHGFEVQRSGNKAGAFLTVSGLIAGCGTTMEPHNYSFIDETAGSPPFFYRLRQIDLDGTVHFSEATAVRSLAGAALKEPDLFMLQQNFPNPFNPSTFISFQLSAGSTVSLTVYDILGQQVAELMHGYASRGRHTVRFDGHDLAAGVYICRLVAGGQIAQMSMLLLR